MRSRVTSARWTRTSKTCAPNSNATRRSRSTS
jgi:hypothetical protein